MKKRKLLFALLMFLSAACASNTLITETVNSDNSTHWWTSWLKSPTCAPPCWENITPGITTKEEAAAILVNMQTIEITYQGEFGVEWVSVKDNTEAGWVNTAQTNIVNAIVLGISSKRVSENYKPLTQRREVAKDSLKDLAKRSKIGLSIKI